MSGRRKLAIAVAGALALAGYTKLVWQSAFDQGSDVALCVVFTVLNEREGKPMDLALGEPACRSAKAGERNPLWLFRRRGGQS